MTGEYLSIVKWSVLIILYLILHRLTLPIISIERDREVFLSPFFFMALHIIPSFPRQMLYRLHKEILTAKTA